MHRAPRVERAGRRDCNRGRWRVPGATGAAIRLFFTCLLLVACAGAGDAAPSRLALVVGIDAYMSLPRLRNAVSDANLIAAKLKASGFDVDFHADATKDALNRAVLDFGRRVAAAGSDAVALVYFAGHGVQDDKRANYLLAANSIAKSQTDLPIEALSVSSLLDTIQQAAPRVTIAIFDACRDNPLPLSSSRGATRGLAPPEARRDFMIVYATEAGQSAQDGPAGGVGPFAAALASAIDSEQVEAAALMQVVARKVYDATGKQQFPLVFGHLTEPFFFHGGAGVTSYAPTGAAQPPAQFPPPTPDRADQGEIEFGRAVATNTVEAYEDWLRKFPDHARKSKGLALLQRLREEELWKRAENATSPEDKIRGYELLLLAMPDGGYAQRTRERLAALRAQPDPTPVTVPRDEPVQDAVPASPSFNCAFARTTVERLLCSNGSLAKLDRDLFAVFQTAVRASRSPAALNREEAQWIGRRDACGAAGTQSGVISCVSRAYEGRIAELRQPASETADPSFNCAFARARDELIVCSSVELADADRRLSTLFANRLAQTRARTALRNAQAAWMSRRGACASIASRSVAIACIARVYADRINELSYR